MFLCGGQTYYSVYTMDLYEYTYLQLFAKPIKIDLIVTYVAC